MTKEIKAWNKKYILYGVLISLFTPFSSIAGKCDHPDDLDSIAQRCGAKAESVIPWDRLGADGRYIDSEGRDRIYGPSNDPYDKSEGESFLSRSFPR